MRRKGYLSLPGSGGGRRIPLPVDVYAWLDRHPVFQAGARLTGNQIQLHLLAAMRHLRRIESDKWQLHPLIQLYNHGLSRLIRLAGYDEAFYLTGRRSMTNYRRFYKPKDAMGLDGIARTGSLAALRGQPTP